MAATTAIAPVQDSHIPSKTFYYKAIQRSFPRVVDAASSGGDGTFLIPVMSSLPDRIDVAFVRTHILTPSPYFKGEFVSKDGKVVAIKDKSVMCRQGFRYPRNVEILGEETCYNDNFESFKLYLVSAPLVGELRNAGNVTFRKERDSLAVARRPLADHKKCVRRHIDKKAVPLFIRSLNEFIGHFKQNYVLVKGFADDAAMKCRAKCRSTIAAVFDGREDIDAQVMAELNIATDSILLNALKDKIFGGICKLYKQEDDELYERIVSLREQGAEGLGSELGVRSGLRFKPDSAVDRLKQFNSSDCSTPLMKLCCLQDVQDLISKSVETKADSPEVLAADDMLPLFALVIAMCDNQLWFSNLEFLNHFSPESEQLSAIDAGKLGYQLANFQAAVDLVSESMRDDKRDESDALSAASLSAKQLPRLPQHSEAQLETGLSQSQSHIQRKRGEFYDEEDFFRPNRKESTHTASGADTSAATASMPPPLQRRTSQIREGGSSARSRALRRLKKQELEKKKRESMSNLESKGDYVDDIDRALMQIGFGASNSKFRRPKAYAKAPRRTSGRHHSGSVNEHRRKPSLVSTLMSKKETVLAGENR
eukprot:CAMPEP_0197526308 /NCGR_PEP_ID=MMETSP1318-20131121/17270_1 /TAXON_ID=552666 /ORGANISM="Partenskyella glossopodia, Strain RCC365" /LENGTH=594 /DNA_ID=CAMNT_0043080413 /DNA_START=87 /DNA_END=1874 /DNA_ORIENTATION=+